VRRTLVSFCRGAKRLKRRSIVKEMSARIKRKLKILEDNSSILFFFLATSRIPRIVSPRSLNRTPYAKMENAKLIFPKPEAPRTLAR